MKLKKVLACLLCVTCVGAGFTGCGSAAEDVAAVGADNNVVYENEDQAALMQVVSSVATTGSSTAGKEETVYVKSNADGSTYSVVVSDWLKNDGKTTELKDYTQLSDIKNVKGSETYTESEDGIVWNAGGNDIYYQGTTDKELPVSVRIGYELDGTPISTEELAGKSGHLVITIAYENNEKQEVEIGGHTETIYTPFAVVSGMMLNREKFSNVTVSNGTVVSDGNRDVVVGMAFPGLVDSLNGQSTDSELLDKIEEKLSIPSNVVIEADVADFEMGMVLTMVSSDVARALGLENLDTDLDMGNLEDSVSKLTDAGSELADGTGSLKDGAEKLANGTSSLVTGTTKLHDGVVAYTDGVSKVADGASKLDEGAAKLDGGVGELQSGISAVNQGANELKSGIDQVNGGAGQLSAGAKQLSDGAKEVSDGAASVSDGVNSLTSKMGEITTGVGSAAEGATTISGGINSLVTAVSTETSADDIDTSAISVSGTISTEAAAQMFLNSLPAENMAALGLTTEQTEALNSILAAVAGQVIPAAADGAATAAAKTATAAGAAKGANEVKSAVYAGLVNTGLQAGAAQLSSSLNTSYATLTSAEAAAQLTALKNGAASLASGASQVAEGAGNLKNGADSLYSGTQQLANGSAKLADGTSQLSSGAATLKAGTGELKSGTSALASGTAELNANSGALREGSATLADGSATLADGIGQLLSGAVKLNDGMVQFNEEGLSKLTEVFDTDLDLMSSRIKAISEAGKAYKSFAGASEDEDSTVKFIIETAEIRK